MTTVWTQFWDMHSGGGVKEPPYHYIYIEASQDEARVIFYNRFGHNPDRVSCTCCGPDYAVDEHTSLEQLTGYHRGCRNLKQKKDPATGRYSDDPVFHGNYYLEKDKDPLPGYEVENRLSFKEYCTVNEYAQREDVLMIYADEIKPDERTGDVPRQGYVWQD